MKVTYSCKPCRVYRVEVEVPDRGPSEDITHWVGQTVGFAIGFDHLRRSPHCKSRVMDEVLIPVPPGTDAIGKPVKH